MLAQLQADEQLHSLLLFAAGHRLLLHKCSFYLVSFLRHNLTYRCKTKEELPGYLELREGFNLPLKPVPRLEPWQTHKTLAHFILVTGGGDEQRKVIKKLVNNWTMKIK